MGHLRNFEMGVFACLLAGSLAGCHSGSNTSVSSQTEFNTTTQAPVCLACENAPVARQPVPIRPIPVLPTPDPTPTDPFRVCPMGGYCGGPIQAIGYSNDTGDATKDVDLQAAEIQDASLRTRATDLQEHYQMSFQAAVQVTELSDKVRALQANGRALTPEDENAVFGAAFAIAGVQPAEVANAVAKSLDGDNSAEDALLTKAAANMHMSQAVLRDQLLPLVGVRP